MKRRAIRPTVRSDVFWRQWERAGGHDLVHARAAAFAEMDPASLAAYQRDPVAWSRAFDASWRKQQGIR